MQLLLRQALASLHVPAPHHAVLAGRQQHTVLVGPVQPRDAPPGAGQPQHLRGRGRQGTGLGGPAWLRSRVPARCGDLGWGKSPGRAALGSTRKGCLQPPTTAAPGPCTNQPPSVAPARPPHLLVRLLLRLGGDAEQPDGGHRVHEGVGGHRRQLLAHAEAAGARRLVEAEAKQLAAVLHGPQARRGVARSGQQHLGVVCQPRRGLGRDAGWAVGSGKGGQTRAHRKRVEATCQGGKPAHDMQHASNELGRQRALASRPSPCSLAPCCCCLSSTAHRSCQQSRPRHCGRQSCLPARRCLPTTS